MSEANAPNTAAAGATAQAAASTDAGSQAGAGNTNPAPSQADVAAAAERAAQAVAGHDANSAMRLALLRSQVSAALGPVQAPWVIDQAIAASKPDLLADFGGLTGPSLERVNAFKAGNAWAFTQAAAAVTTAATAAQTQASAQTQGGNVQEVKTLPADPGSSVSGTGGLTTEQNRQLAAVHINPAKITAHPDWARVRAFFGVQGGAA